MHNPFTSISTSRAIAISLVVLGFVLSPKAYAQQRPAPAEAKDSTALWQGFQVMTDLVGPIQLAVGSYGQIEGGLRINLKDRYFPIVELGIGSANYDDVNTHNHYDTRAPYGKIGVDYNVLKNKHDIYRLYAGVRYAYTRFKAHISNPGITDPVWGDTMPIDDSNVQASCGWAEGVIALDAKIWGPLHLGWSARYKLRLHHNDGHLGNIWYVPGYGTRSTSQIGGTFNVIIDL